MEAVKAVTEWDRRGEARGREGDIRVWRVVEWWSGNGNSEAR